MPAEHKLVMIMCIISAEMAYTMFLCSSWAIFKDHVRHTIDDREQCPSDLHHGHNDCRWKQPQSLDIRSGGLWSIIYRGKCVSELTDGCQRPGESSKALSSAYHVQARHPEGRCNDEGYEVDPHEPGPELAVALYRCPQQQRQCLAEQHALRAQQRCRQHPTWWATAMSRGPKVDIE